MAGQNDYKLFCTANPDGVANSLTPAEYAALTTILANGFQTGVADAPEANTVWRQATMAVAALAKIISDAGFNAVDDRNVANFANALILALRTNIPVARAGDLKMSASNTVPSLWLPCDGRSLARTSYSALFGNIGTAYGAADADHFNLPDLRGVFPRGYDAGRGQDPGRVFGTYQADALLSHQHVVSGLGNTGRAQPGDTGDLLVEVPGGSVTTQFTGAAGETRPKNVAILFLIYTGV